MDSPVTCVTRSLTKWRMDSSNKWIYSKTSQHAEIHKSQADCAYFDRCLEKFVFPMSLNTARTLLM